ncbi:MAG: prolipoprotein diacylglyceryl transferase, partial [Parvibaculum sp.]|nr:prolipoprotein diacylglyceryl transferase [Parvibaculum sp.]
ARTIVEFFREPDAQIGFLFGQWLTMGMMLSIPMALVGAAIIWKSATSKAPTPKPKRK